MPQGRLGALAHDSESVGCACIVRAISSVVVSRRSVTQASASSRWRAGPRRATPSTSSYFLARPGFDIVNDIAEWKPLVQNGVSDSSSARPMASSASGFARWPES